MASDDMNHMQHLESVALSDVAVLQSKEATYQGSWKRAGGRSAWFMARRNMDRLLTMMPAKPVNDSIKNLENVRSTLMSLKQTVHYNFAPLNQTVAPLPGSIEGTMAILDHVLDAYTADDVFARISQHPKGEDGTVLACIRDLRRYFMLVEAEMIAEGVVENESETYEQEHWPVDVYTAIADETGLDRDEVKRRCHEACYSASPPPATDPGPAIGGAFEELPDTPSCGDGAFDARVRREIVQRAAEQRSGPPTPRTPEAGSHHSSLVPWEIGQGYFNTLAARVGLDLMNAFYTRRTPELWRLEPVVSSGNVPRELKDCYDFTRVDDLPRFVLKRGNVPSELDDQFPRLLVELNVYEWETSEQAFKFMYSKADEKMILRQDYMNWARET